ncbi:MAG: Calx-beta domain-containing protein, partial [Bacteroidota bacterium]
MLKITITPKSDLAKLIFIIFLVLFINQKTIAQTKGLIYEPATNIAGISVLDPNEDGYISVSPLGFTSAVEGTPGNDVPEFENTSDWHNFPTIGSGEVLRDIRSGPDEGFTDFSITDDGSATYYRYDGTNLIFRFRLADYRPNSKGYTVLIDTDGLFGDGNDPEYSSENPGFEVAIVLQNKQDVFVYDINTATPDCTPPILHSYVGGTNHQKSISGIQDDGDLDFFYDFYIPVSDLSLTGITVDASTPLRMAATTNTSNSYTFCGSLSDVGGVDDNAYAGCLECLFTDLIDGQVPTSPDNTTGFPAERTDCPTILGDYGEGTISLSGISEANAAITIYRDPDYSTVIATATADANGDWTTSTFSALSGEVYAATAQVTGESESMNICTSVTIDAVTCTGMSPTGTIIVSSSGEAPIQVSYSGSFDFAAAQAATIIVYANGVNITTTTGSEADMGMVTAPTDEGTYAEWTFDMVNGGEKVPCGTITFTLEDNTNGSCASTSGSCNTAAGCSKLGIAPTPTITTGSIFTSTTTISGTSDVSGGNIEITLYAGGTGFATTTADASTGAWTATGLDLSAYLCQEITATANYPDGCSSAHSTPAITITEAANAPTITDPGFCGSTTYIYGTSFESDGTTPNHNATIQVYINGSGTAESQTATVDTDGNWTISGLLLAAGDNVQVTTTDDNHCQSESVLSNQITINAIPVNTGLSITTVDGTVGNDVYEGSTSLAGTCDPTATIVKVYIDEIFLADAAISGGTWTLNPIPVGELYEGGKIQTTQSFGGCESNLSTDNKIVQCSSIPGATALSPYTQTCDDITNTSIPLEISGVESGYIYTLVDDSGNDLGYSQYSGGTTNLTLATLPLPTTPDPAIIGIRAEKLNPGIDCSTSSTNTLSIDLNPHMSLIESASTPATCIASDGTISISSLGESATYELSYVRNGEAPVISTISSEANGTYIITGLSNGEYTDITLTNTANSCTSTPFVEVLEGGGTTATSFPVSANPTSISSGGSSTISVGDVSNSTNAGYTYYLYDRGTNTEIASSLGNGGILDFSTGAITAITTYYVYVDEGGSCVTLTSEPTVTVGSNTPPVIVDATVSINENSANSTSVYDVNEDGTGNDTDADSDALTYSIVSGNGDGIFSINASTGQITVTDNTNLDYETTSSYSLVVRADDGTDTDDATITVNITDATINAVLNVTTHGNETIPTDIVYTITLSSTNNTGSAITFDFDDLITGTATSGTDYTAVAAAAQISVADGASTGTITIPVLDDAIFEHTETVIAQISNASSNDINITTSTATANITDNEAAPLVSLSVSSSTIAENGGSSNLIATLNNATTTDVDVTITYTGTATNGTDYTGTAIITILAGNTTGSITITGTNDVIYETNEDIIADITAVTNATEDGIQQETITIIDDDNAPLITINDASATEGNNVQFTVNLSNPSSEDITVTLDLTDGTATGGTDYTATNVTVTIPAGSTSVIANVPTTD